MGAPRQFRAQSPKIAGLTKRSFENQIIAELYSLIKIYNGKRVLLPEQNRL